jgi:hypothetical protein
MVTVVSMAFSHLSYTKNQVKATGEMGQIWAVKCLPSGPKYTIVLLMAAQ